MIVKPIEGDVEEKALVVDGTKLQVIKQSYGP
jgi:hypothetical protein